MGSETDFTRSDFILKRKKKRVDVTRSDSILEKGKTIQSSVECAGQRGGIVLKTLSCVC